MPGPVNADSSAAEKVRFFRSLFAGRDDVYALRWQNDRSGRSGWMPAVRGGYRRGQSNRSYLPLTDEVIAAHLTGEIHAGLYPLMPGDTCLLLVCDFDGPTALLDSLAYLKAARMAEVPAALEISRSGRGAHAWTFFAEPVPATAARRVGAGLLREAIAIRGEMDLSSYDRLFPAQDYLPASGSIGNLIALPLQGLCRRRHGTTVFLDLATLEPYADQFHYLSRLERLRARRVADLAEQVRPPTVGPGLRNLHPSGATGMHPAPPPVIRARLDAGVSIERAGLPPALMGSLKHAASLHNPEFYQREKRRLPTYGTPRFIRCYQEDLDWLHLPRGLLELASALVSTAGSRLEIVDERPQPAAQAFSFDGELTRTQRDALDELRRHEYGVLEASPGAGKTVIACALIADLQMPTLILVDRTTLLDQWRRQIQAFLGVKTGQVGGGRSRRTGVIDLASLQTLARRDDVAGLLAGYGLVVADECHHLPAATVERATRPLTARRWLGLTATPYRNDRLDEMILMLCGPVRHRIRTAKPGSPSPGAVQREVFVHQTSFHYDESLDVSTRGVIQQIYGELVDDETRNRGIVNDVTDALQRGRNCLILTDQTRHLENLARGFSEWTDGIAPVLLHGKLGAKARRAAIETLNNPPPGQPTAAVATSSFIGEGFDCPGLDTLFLVFPIKFRGRVIQYVGRVLREHPSKTSVEVHDYLDIAAPVLAHRHKERCKAYTELAFNPPLNA